MVVDDVAEDSRTGHLTGQGDWWARGPEPIARVDPASSAPRPPPRAAKDNRWMLAVYAQFEIRGDAHILHRYTGLNYRRRNVRGKIDR